MKTPEIAQDRVGENAGQHDVLQHLRLITRQGEDYNAWKMDQYAIAEIESLRHEREQLATAIRDAARKAGICSDGTDLTVPQLLAVCEGIGNTLSGSPDSSSTPVKYWDCYNSEYPTVNTHQFDVNDQRKTNGQMYLDLGASEGWLDDMLSIVMEVNTNPLNGIDHVPCVHVNFDGDNPAISLFKIGNKILLRQEVDVEIKQFKEAVPGIAETLYWIE